MIIATSLLYNRLMSRLFLLVLWCMPCTLFAHNHLLHNIPDTSAVAQDSLKRWKLGGLGSISSTQLFISNWASGGQSSFSASGFLNLFANYKHDKTNWDNSVELAYGFIRQKDIGFAKADDKIEVNSQYGRKAFQNFNYSALVNFKTQFDEGYSSPGDTVKISDFLAPAYIITSIGLDYKPSSNFNVLISPFTGKTTIVNDQQLADEGRFGVEKATLDKNGEVAQSGNRIWYQFGGFIKTLYKRELMENVNMQLKLDLFTNYVQNAQNIDVNSELLIAMRVNKYITTNLSANLIYDDDIDVPIEGTDREGPRTQFKELLGVGLSYKF